MKKHLRGRRPSPGTVFGLVALIVALAGTAVAGPLATDSALTKKEKNQTRKIARAEIAKAAPKLSVRSAQTATNAQNAQTAVNAGQVDGHDAVCPAGTFLQSGVCFETVATANSPWSGGNACADAGGRLPSIAELISIRNVTGVDLGPNADGTWADVTYDDAATEEAAMVDDSGDVEFDAVGGMHQIRCAFNLVR